MIGYRQSTIGISDQRLASAIGGRRVPSSYLSLIGFLVTFLVTRCDFFANANMRSQQYKSLFTILSSLVIFLTIQTKLPYFLQNPSYL